MVPSLRELGVHLRLMFLLMDLVVDETVIC